MNNSDTYTVANYAKDKDIAVFGATYCKYCKSAKVLLEEMKHPSWVYVDIDDHPHELVEALKKDSNHKTIPIIYVKDKDKKYTFLGGYDKLKESIKKESQL